MARLTIKEAVAIAPVSESTLRARHTIGAGYHLKSDDRGTQTHRLRGVGAGIWSIETVNRLK